MARYLVGCAGQFALGQTRGYDDVDEAIAACEWPPGCEVYDTVEKRGFGPTCQEEIDEAKARLTIKAIKRALELPMSEYIAGPLRAALYRVMGMERSLREHAGND